MFCSIAGANIEGISAHKICVEADISGGLPSFNMVGMLASEVKEAKERVERAITNSGIEFPSRRITINISPANMRKQGTGFDLPIAVAILCCMGLIDIKRTQNMLFCGELSLDGRINRVNGILPIALAARNEGIKTLVVPVENTFEGAVIEGVDVCGVKNLHELIDSLKNDNLTKAEHIELEKMLNDAYAADTSTNNYKEVKGQDKAKRATMIAAAGFHNILYVGPPGSGKSMLAGRISTISDRLSVEESIEISKIYSVTGKLDGKSLVLKRPFRAPHHSVTMTALAGGGNIPRPGEITLAHKGVLFLDEAAEFKRENIEILRQPLEDKKILISRARQQIEYPADFMLVMAMNPCRCGFYPDRRLCRCTENEIAAYVGKIKGPVLDRIDVCVGTIKLEPKELSGKANGMSSEEMREKILEAHERQRKRFAGTKIGYNSKMTSAQTDEFCRIDAKSRDVLNKAYKKFNMTARGYYKILKVSRTIADVEGKEDIDYKHIIEAIGYRIAFENRL